MNRRWVYGTVALVLALSGAAIVAYLDSARDVEPQIVDLTIPSGSAPAGYRSIPLDPAMKVTHDEGPTAPLSPEDRDFPELAVTDRPNGAIPGSP